MQALPTIPRHLDRSLLDEDLHRLEAQHPGMPRSIANCITCRGQKTFRWYAPGTTEPTDWRCDCASQYKLHVHLLHAGVGLNYQRLSWNDADGVEAAAVEVLADYRANASNYVAAGIGLVLNGRMGTGKTMGATLLGKDLLRAGYDVYAVSFQEFLTAFADGWARDEAGRAAQQRFDQRIRHAEVLVLDDLGRESGLQNHVVSILDHVLRFRVSDQRPSLLTTNKSLVELGQLYSSNALDLLAESTIEHEFLGQSYRDAARKRRVAEAAEGLTRPIML